MPAMSSGATDASGPAGLIRASQLVPAGRGASLQQGNVTPRTYRGAGARTDEPSAHPWHQVSIDARVEGTHRISKSLLAARALDKAKGGAQMYCWAGAQITAGFYWVISRVPLCFSIDLIYKLLPREFLFHACRVIQATGSRGSRSCTERTREAVSSDSRH